MNVATFIGRIGKDAQVRYTQGGKPITAWSIAVDTGFGENKQTMWIDCNWWGDRATKVADYIRKGDRIGVSGELGRREHEGKTYLTLNVANVTLLGEKREGAPAPAPARGPKPSAPSGDGFDDDSVPF